MFNRLIIFKKIAAIGLSMIITCSLFGCTILDPNYYADMGAAFDGYKQFATQVFAKGITFSVAMRGGKEKAAFKEMNALMTDINNDMSLSLSSSALSLFNNQAESDLGNPIEIHKLTYDIIVKAKEIYEKTDGAFNIAVPELSKAWHVDIEGLSKYGGLIPNEMPPEPPKYEEIQQMKNLTDLNMLSAFEQGERYYIKKDIFGLKIDLGAIAKGFSADECIKIVKKHGVKSAFIDISGNLYLYGKWYRAQEKKYVDWEVGVTAPRPRGGISGLVCAVRTSIEGAVVTSGDYERYYTYYYPDGSPLNISHIIDSRTGMPVGIKYNDVTDKYENTSDYVVATTVFTYSSAEADAYATAVCVLGYDNGLKIFANQNMEGIIFTEDKRMALVGISAEENTDKISLSHTDNPEFIGYKEYKLATY